MTMNSYSKIAKTDFFPIRIAFSKQNTWFGKGFYDLICIRKKFLEQNNKKKIKDVIKESIKRLSPVSIIVIESPSDDIVKTIKLYHHLVFFINKKDLLCVPKKSWETRIVLTKIFVNEPIIL